MKVDNMPAKAICPVMGSPVDKETARNKQMVRTFQGETVYLCCDTCVKLFDKEPARYVGKGKTSE